MTKENDIPTESESDASPPHAMQVKIAMHQGEHTGQPIYSNLTSAQSGQGVIVVDFGFLDPQTMNALNHMLKSGDKTANTINAKMSCRIAINIGAANQLAQQLDQVINKKTLTPAQTDQNKFTDQTRETSPNNISSEEKNNTSANGQSGFRFPWSKKSH